MLANSPEHVFFFFASLSSCIRLKIKSTKAGLKFLERSQSTTKMNREAHADLVQGVTCVS